jgi:replication-associated recombination protein RarA
MPRKPPVAPTCFVPSCPADFVGQAGKVAEMLMRKAERLRTNPDQPLKLLVSGAPGIGKTSLVNMIARTLASHPVAIEDVNGKEVGLEPAREWTRSLAYGSLFGSCSVKVVNELDRCSKDAQDMLLNVLSGKDVRNITSQHLNQLFQGRFAIIQIVLLYLNPMSIDRLLASF